MDGSGLPEHNHDQRLVQYLQARFDVPAYMRRAQQVQESLDCLLGRCRRCRQEWVPEGQRLLEDLALQVAGWDDLSPWLPSPTNREVLPQLKEILGAQVRFLPRPAAPRRRHRALQQLNEWLHRFNRRWLAFLQQLDLQPINQLRDGYNRYFVLEKECALRSARLARQGFQRLEPVTVADLLRQFPLLPLPVGSRGQTPPGLPD